MVDMSRLCTVHIGTSTRAGRIDGDDIVILDAADVGDVLRAGGEVAETGEAIPRETARLAPVVTTPDKVVCVGVNYLDHIEEMGRDRPSAPTYFAKFANSLIGATDDLVLPPVEVSTHIDWEVELAIVIGSPVRHASPREALAAVAGYTVMNDGSVRDFQRRTTQFLAGKMFEGLSPLGPVLVGVDELGDVLIRRLKQHTDMGAIHVDVRVDDGAVSNGDASVASPGHVTVDVSGSVPGLVPLTRAPVRVVEVAPIEGWRPWP
ncbi:MAG: 2-hydroxyhepta-2,4-diene-1,7-dioate isomerase [Actinobacteria bacterium]|nr:2-hydroxyhepta-2,4-diene-1,7-dioate isomerase [Actinomycetota bacterium]